MLHYILAIACTEVQSAKYYYQSRIQIEDARFDECHFSLFLHNLVYIFTRLVHHLFNARRLDATIFDKLLKCHSSHFSTDRIETREQNRAWRVINKRFHARIPFESSNVASLFADDFALNLIGWNGHQS